MEPSKKRPLENGFVPKYKPRRVSVIREFPVGCGPNSMPVNLKSSENGGGVARAVVVGIEMGCQSNDIFDVVTTESLDAIVGNVMVDTNGGVLGNVKSDSSSAGQTSVGGQVASKDIKGGDHLTSLKKSDVEGVPFDDKELFRGNSQSFCVGVKDEYQMGRVSAVRHFPPHCGPSASLLTEEEKLMITATKLKNVQENEEIAVGHIPLHCGSSVSLPTEEERLTITTTKSKNVQENEAIEGMPPASQRECLDGPSRKKETILCSVDRDDKGGPIDSGLGPVKEEAASKNSDDGASAEKMTQQKLSQPIDSGLSFVKEEVASKNSDGGASAEIVTQQKLSQLTSDTVGASNHEIDGSLDSSYSLEEGEYLEDSDNEGVSKITPVSMASPDTSAPDSSESVPKEMVNYSVRKATQKKPLDGDFGPAGEVDRKVVGGVMASQNCPSRKGPTVSRSPDAKTNVSGIGKQNLSWRLNVKAVAKKSTLKSQTSGFPIKAVAKKSSSKSQTSGFPIKAVSKKSIFRTQTPGFPIKRKLKKVRITAAHQTSGDEEDQTCDFEVNLPSLGPNSSGDIRDRVRDTLQMFHAVCRKLMQQEEARSKKSEKKIKRFDLAAATIIKQKGKEVNNTNLFLGEVPGVEVGDEFQYRVELSIVGVHRLYQAGIDSMKYNNGDLVALSIVSSGSYMDDVENADVLVYSGQGGNVVGKKREQPEDQKLEKGNLALKNSIHHKTPVRVVRGWRDSVVDPHSSRPKLVMTYVYDGLYTAERYWTETGPHGKKVFMFELRRNAGQPELAWKELKKLKKLKSRPGVCVNDVSGGKEPFGICAVNTLDNEKPPKFNYISKMVYPGWHTPIAPPGCDCKGKCSDSKICKCAARNDGEIPYTRNEALVETKLLVYECGPHCKCPPSCYNRVSQRGIRYQLEIFKTKSRGWGVRPLTSIPSGGFICEYAGELLNDTDAEKRIDTDEYLFDIGKNLTESSVNPEDEALSTELVEDGGYTVDACKYGNVGRFINHSCRPNLYAQNVVYDHNDLKMPHIMLFAMENIPPLKELTYHYNYMIDQVHDADGNIKVKKCYCGAAECTGRLY